MTSVDWLRPFSYGFFVDGLVAAVLAGAVCGLVGVFVVLRSLSYLGHGLSHSVFGGYAVGAVLGLPLVLAAAVWGLATTLLVNVLVRRRPVGADAAIGVVTTSAFAIGVAVAVAYPRDVPDFEALLFGSVLGVDDAALALLAGVLVLALVVVTGLYRQLLFSTFDPVVARASGVRVGLVDAALMTVLCLTVLATLNVIGVTLVAATLVIPAVIGRMCSDAFARVLAVSTAVGATGGGVGIYLAFLLDVPPGTTIVLVEAAAFLLALAVTGASGARRASSLRTTAAARPA